MGSIAAELGRGIKGGAGEDGADAAAARERGCAVRIGSG
jgi:hypothetical protein